MCPACAWRELAAPDQEGADTAEAGARFAVAGYDGLAEIARGGSAIVYRARQREPRRDVALKMLLPQQLSQPDLRARFRLEAETIATLEHPAILPVYATGEHDGLPFFTMMLATGGALSARRDALRGQWRAIATLVAGLADAVQFAHARGVIHRDIKPGNVLFDASDRVYLSDFGLAKFLAGDVAATRTMLVMGTPAYLAPEVAEAGAGQATIASDVYGLGAVLYELLAGRPPFAADGLTALLKLVAERAPEPPGRTVTGVPRDLEVIALRCLEKTPARRYASAAALAEDLRLWLAGRPIHARPVGAGERLVRWARRNPALATLSALLSVALIGGGAMLAQSNAGLRAALAQTRAAEAFAREKLHAALLAEARLLRQSGRHGQRLEAVAVLERAAQIAPTAEVRSELIAALAKPDLALVKRLPAHFPGQLFVTDFSPGLGSYLTALPEGGLALRGTAEGEIVRRYRLPPGVTVSRSRFADQGRFFSATLSDKRTGFWAVEREEPLWLMPPVPDGVAAKSALHPSAPVVAYRGPAHEILIRDLSTGAERELLAGGARIHALGFDPAGRRLFVARADGGSLLEVETGRVLWSVGETILGAAPAWSRDGTRLATGNYPRPEIAVREAETGRTLQVLSGHTTHPDLMAFQPDGRRLVSVAFDRTLRLWDVPGERELLTAPWPMRALRISPDGRRLGAADEPDSLALFEWAREEVFGELAGKPGIGATTTGLDLSRDGRWVLSSVRFQRDRAWLRHVRLWDARRGVERGEFEFPEAGEMTVRFQPGVDAISYGGTTAGWQRRTFAEDGAGELRWGAEEPWENNGKGAGPQDWLRSPDGRYFMEPGARGGVDLREARTRDRLAHLEPPLAVQAVLMAWAPDGGRIYFLVRGPRLFFWDVAVIRRELAARGLDW